MTISKHISQFLDRLYPNESGPIIPSGITSLDSAIQGLRPGNLYLICGTREVGKTAFAVQMVNSIVCSENEHQRVAYFSLHLSGDQITERLRSNLSKVGIGEITRKDLNKDQIEVVLEDARLTLQRSHLYIDDTAILDLEKLKERIYLLSGCEQADIVFIDKLQLLGAPGEIGDLGKAYGSVEVLKTIAVDLNIPIVLLADYEEDQGEYKQRPRLQDLSEQKINIKHPDVVLCFYRPEYYKKEIGETDLIVLKNSWGALGTIKLVADLSIQNFREQEL